MRRESPPFLGGLGGAIASLNDDRHIQPHFFHPKEEGTLIGHAVSLVRFKHKHQAFIHWDQSKIFRFNIRVSYTNKVQCRSPVISVNIFPQGKHRVTKRFIRQFLPGTIIIKLL